MFTEVEKNNGRGAVSCVRPYEQFKCISACGNLHMGSSLKCSGKLKSLSSLFSIPAQMNPSIIAGQRNNVTDNMTVITSPVCNNAQLKVLVSVGSLRLSWRSPNGSCVRCIKVQRTWIKHLCIKLIAANMTD